MAKNSSREPTATKRHFGRMNQIMSPKQPGPYPDREIDCEEAMDMAVAALIDAAGQAGWTIPEVLDAIAKVVPHQRKAYYIDPDPADDPVYDPN